MVGNSQTTRHLNTPRCSLWGNRTAWRGAPAGGGAQAPGEWMVAFECLPPNLPNTTRKWLFPAFQHTCSASSHQQSLSHCRVGSCALCFSNCSVVSPVEWSSARRMEALVVANVIPTVYQDSHADAINRSSS